MKSTTRYRQQSLEEHLNDFHVFCGVSLQERLTHLKAELKHERQIRAEKVLHVLGGGRLCCICNDYVSNGVYPVWVGRRAIRSDRPLCSTCFFATAKAVNRRKK